MSFGNYTWWVRGWSTDGNGPWSSPLSFVLGVSAVLSPAGMVSVNPPTVTWQKVDMAAQYNLWIDKSNASFFTQTFVGSDSTNWTSGTVLPFGSYKVWIRAQALPDAGVWSSPVDFNVP